jgi:hypothetical protein
MGTTRSSREVSLTHRKIDCLRHLDCLHADVWSLKGDQHVVARGKSAQLFRAGLEGYQDAPQIVLHRLLSVIHFQNFKGLALRICAFDGSLHGLAIPADCHAHGLNVFAVTRRREVERVFVGPLHTR